MLDIKSRQKGQQNKIKPKTNRHKVFKQIRKSLPLLHTEQKTTIYEDAQYQMKSKQLSSSTINTYQKFRGSLSSSLQHQKIQTLVVHKLKIDSSTIDSCQSLKKSYKSPKPNAKIMKCNPRKQILPFHKQTSAQNPENKIKFKKSAHRNQTPLDIIKNYQTEKKNDFKQRNQDLRKLIESDRQFINMNGYLQLDMFLLKIRKEQEQRRILSIRKWMVFQFQKEQREEDDNI